MARIVITGASGSGTTTLGPALADRLKHAHPYVTFDADEAFWVPTDPPFTTKRPLAERDRYVRSRLEHLGDWILTGSVVGWEWPRPAMDIDLVVFVLLPPELRMARLRAREIERYGEAALAPGGRMHDIHTGFLAWAARYDTAGLEQRSRTSHEAWLLTCRCPVLRIDGDMTVAQRVTLVADALRQVPPQRAAGSRVTSTP